MQGSHVERSTSVLILHVGVGPSFHQQLHTEGTMVREGSIVQGCLSLVVERVEAHLVLEEDVHHHILTVVAGHMERGAAIGIHSIRLGGRGGKGEGKRKRGGRRRERRGGGRREEGEGGGRGGGGRKRERGGGGREEEGKGGGKG